MTGHVLVASDSSMTLMEAMMPLLESRSYQLWAWCLRIKQSAASSSNLEQD